MAAPAESNRPRALVISVGLDALAAAEAPRLAQTAEQALVRSERFDVISLADAFDPEAAHDRQLHLQEAETAFQAGMSAYDGLDTQKSVGLFDKAVKAYELTDLTRNFNALTKAWAMRIASHVANGDARVARAEIDRLLAVAPKAELSARYFPPEELAYVDRTRRSAATSTLTLKTGTIPARIYVDGLYRGVSPVTVSKLAPSEHYVTAIAPGYSLRQEKVRETSSTLTLKRALHFSDYEGRANQIIQAPEGAARDRATQSLAQELDADQAVVAVAKKSSTGDKLDLIALRLDAVDGHNYAFQEKQLSVREGGESFFLALAERDATRVNGPVTHYRSGGTPPMKTAGYALIGTGAALVAASIATGVVALVQQNEYNRTIHSDPQAAEAPEAIGKTYRDVSTGLTVGGVVVGGAGALLSFFGGREGTSSSDADSPRALPRKQRRAALDVSVTE
ncbi:MAG: PEGA domain-containing protein [Myxococcaceae bacterium]